MQIELLTNLSDLSCFDDNNKVSRVQKVHMVSHKDACCVLQ